MSKTLADFDQFLTALVRDVAETITLDDRYQAITLAVAEHSSLRPWRRVAALTGNGTSVLGVPSGWVQGSSHIQRIEYPLAQIPPTYLRDYAWQEHSTATATQIVFSPNWAPGATATILVHFTSPHGVTASGSTIPDTDYPAVATLGASYACLQLAGYYAQSGEPKFGTEVQMPGNRSDVYRALSQDFRNRYRLAVGLGPEGSAQAGDAACTFGELPAIAVWDRCLSYTLYRGRW